MLVVQVTVFVVGAVLLWRVATPLYFDELSSLGSVSWPLLWAPALAFAVLSGTFAGLSVRRGWHWWVATMILVLVGLPALYAPMFFVAEWPGSTVPETNFTDLVAALLGWSLYAIASVGLAVAIGTPDRNHLRRS